MQVKWRDFVSGRCLPIGFSGKVQTISKKTRKRNGRKTRERKRRILKRIENRPGPEREQPMMTTSNIHYELADRVQGLTPGVSAPCSCWLAGGTPRCDRGHRPGTI